MQQQQTVAKSKKTEDKVKSIIGKHLPQINKTYNTNLQLARFTDLKVIEDSKAIIEAGMDKDKGDEQSIVYFINGDEQPSEGKLFDKFTYLFIRNLDNKIDKIQYTLVYFAGDEVMQSNFTRFRSFMKLLPVKYYVRLKQMYVYHASLLVRSFLFFENSKRGKLWKQRTTFIGSYTVTNIFSLNELFSLQSFHKRWIEYVPEHCKEGIDLTNFKKMRAESLQMNPVPSKDETASIFNQELSIYSLNIYGIPVILDHLLSYFSRVPTRFHNQFIFRKQGSVSETLQLAQLLSEGHFDTLKIIDDVNVVADIIKKIFFSMPTPLITFTLHNIIVESLPNLHQENQYEFVQAIIGQMPQLNRKVLQVMLSFMLNIVQYQDINKMDFQSIAQVFTPCLIRSQEQDMLTIQKCIYPQIEFMKLMMTHFPSIFPNISYRLFLQQPNESTSTSSNSSAGIENQISQFEEEQKMQNFQEPDIGESAGQIDDEEFTIDDIVGNARHDKPIQLRKTRNSRVD